MPAPPARTELSDVYPNPSNGTMRAGMGKLWDYVTGFLGLTGSAADARTALGVPAETDAMLLGNPVCSTQAAGNNSTRLANTEFATRVAKGFTNASVAGSGDIALSAGQVGTGTLILTGILTGPRNIIVPTAGWRQIVSNQTTGAFALTVKTAAGAGVTVAQGKQKELFCDAVSVFDANTDVNAMPVGMIFDYAGTSAPAGALACPTAPTPLGRTAYAALFAAIGTTWGAGDGATTFGMPWFPIDQVGVQANGNVGTNTAGEVKAHNHTAGAGNSMQGGSNEVRTTTIGSFVTSTTGGPNNLPAGQRVLKCVKF